MECPEGQSYDVSQGKCVAKESAFGDPKADSAIGDLASNGSDVGDKQQVEGCPEGHAINPDSGICEPNQATADKTDNIGQTNTSIATEKKLASIEKSLKALETRKPTAQVGLEDGVHSWKTVAENMAPSLRKYGKFEFDINLESLRSINTKQTKDRSGQVTESFRASPLQLQEAVSISGTHATQDLDTDVAIVPGGLSFRPVFEFAKVKKIEAGMDRARFFKTTIPANGSQTVGTTPSQATQTFTAIEVTPSTITGVYLVGDFDEIENSPFDLLQAIVEGSASSYEDFVATDMLDTKSKEGTLTPGLWIRADTGAVITSSNVASVYLTKLQSQLVENILKIKDIFVVVSNL